MCTNSLSVHVARACLGLLVAASLVGCDDRGVDPFDSDESIVCLFSYSCPQGTHCDLKRCVQECNVDQPCAEGLVCTPRGRCAETAADPADPPARTRAGMLTVDESVRTVRADQEFLTVRLEGEGLVRARVESNAPWLVPNREAFEFEGATELRIPAASASVGGGDAREHTATIRVVSSQGDTHLIVKRRPAISGVFSGSLAFTSIAHDERSFDLDLGETSFAIHVRDDDQGLRAWIDPERSTLWPASSGGAAVSFESHVVNDRLTLRFAQVLDETSAAPLFPARSASIFRPERIGRELTLELEITAEGSLEGRAVETIHGLTSTPVVVEGSARLALRPGVTLADFAASLPLEPTEGPARDPGLPESTCPPLEIEGCDAGSWSCLAHPEEGLLASGYALSNFFAPDSLRAPLFEFLPENTSNGLTPYAVVSAQCLAEVPDLRADASGATGTCVDLERLACARWYAASELSGGLSAQGTMYTARATAELFAMLANEAAIQAATRRFESTATPSEIRSLYLEAHARYDAALFRFFDPRLFEELRAVSPWDAQLGAMSPEVDNDRFPLRLAATAIRRSREMAGKAFDIDRITTTMTTANLRKRAQAGAVLTWLATALAADLDARWRGTAPTLPTNEPLPEVRELGAVMRTMERDIVTLGGEISGLGVSRTYVPLLARTSTADVETNFARLFEIAESSVDRSVTADLTARDSQRSFDRDASVIGQALADESQSILFELADLCGQDFIVGSTPKPSIEECGRSSGSARVALLAIETERLELLRAEQQLAAQHDLYQSRVKAYAQIQSVQAEHVAFVDKTHQMILDLRSAEAAMNGAASIVGGIVAGASTGSPWGAAAGMASGIATGIGESMAVARHRLNLLLKAEALRVEYEISAIEQAQDLYEAALQFQQLETQVLMKANEVARAYATLASLQERVARLVTRHAENAARLARVGQLEVEPSFRIERNTDAADADVALARARRDLYLATRALEYETNTELPHLTSAVLLAPNAGHLDKARACVSDGWNDWRLLVSSTNQYVTELSLARDVLGISGPITDPETGEVLDEGRQFRRFLFDQPYALEGTRAWPALRFGTTLNRENGLFSTLVCNDRIRTIEVKLVGERLEGDRGEVRVLVDGSSKLRACSATAEEEDLMAWNLRPEGTLAPATISAGINAYDTQSSPNQSLFYYAVAQDTWIIAVPDGSSAPANRALDPTLIDDIVLRITHEGVAAGSATASFDPKCNL
jgi:hypothetical protein